jgi:hypothetical protein
MDAKPKRRWYQTSLRTLLLLVTVASAGFGWLGYKVRLAQRQQRAVEAIRELDGEVLFDYQVDSVGDPIALQAPPGPEWLRRWVGQNFFASVVSVSYEPDATDNDLRHLVEFPQLHSLFLGYPRRQLIDLQSRTNRRSHRQIPINWHDCPSRSSDKRECAELTWTKQA